MIEIDHYLLLVTLWVSWCGLHSFLISVSVSQYLEKLLGKHARFYRLAYNLISAITLVVPVLFALSLQRSEMILLDWPEYTGFIRLFLVGIALYLFWSGGRQYDLNHFMGFSQIRTGQMSPLLNDSIDGFSASGVSSLIRHPWYLGGIILVWSVPVRFYPSTVITAVIISGYFLVGIYLEEQKLVRCFGETYRAYQRDVSMLVPLKWLNKYFLKHK